MTDEIWTEEQLNKVLEIEEAPIEYQIEAPGLRNVINLVQDQVSTLAEGELAGDIDGGSEECHLCAANGELCGLCLRKSKIVEMREMAEKRKNLQAGKNWNKATNDSNQTACLTKKMQMHQGLCQGQFLLP